MTRPVVLILTHPADLHADAVSGHLDAAGVEVHRHDTAQLGIDVPVTAQFVAGTVTGMLGDCNLREVTCVWHRRPSEFAGHLAPADAAELRAGVGGVLATLPHLNHPADMAAALKPRQLAAAGCANLLVPDTLISTDRAAAGAYADACGGVDSVIVKAMSRAVAGHVHLGDRHGWQRAAHLTQCRVTAVAHVRLTVVDRRMFAVKITSPHLDWRVDMAACRYEVVPVAWEVAGPVQRLMRSLRLRYGALDFAVDHAGLWWFLEINPNGQWLWLEDEADQPISAAVAAALADPAPALLTGAFPRIGDGP